MTEEIREMLYDFLHQPEELDESSARRIQNEAAAGMALLRKLCSPSLAFDPGTEGGQLLCEYVLRAESGAAATFEEDFDQEIRRLHLDDIVGSYAEAMGYDTQPD